MTDDEPRLRAAQQLVAAEGDEIGSLRQRLRRSRLVRQTPAFEIDQRAAAEVLDKRYSVLAGECGELGRWHRGGETLDRVVAGVRLEDEPSLRPDRRREVGKVGAVGRPDLTQPGAGACHDVWQPKRAANLDQLAARHDSLVPFRQG